MGRGRLVDTFHGYVVLYVGYLILTITAFHRDEYGLTFDIDTVVQQHERLFRHCLTGSRGGCC